MRTMGAELSRPAARAPRQRTRFEKWRPYHLDWKAVGAVALTLRRATDGEEREVTLSEAIKGVVEKGWRLQPRGFFGPRVEINGAESEVRGPMFALDLLRAMAEGDENARTALSIGALYHVDSEGFPEDPIESHTFFMAAGAEVCGTISLAEEWDTGVDLGAFFKRDDPRDMPPDRYEMARTHLLCQRFEAETYLGRLIAADRKITAVDDLGVAVSPETVALLPELRAARRTRTIATQLRTVIWLLVALLVVAIWIAWRVG